MSLRSFSLALVITSTIACSSSSTAPDTTDGGLDSGSVESGPIDTGAIDSSTRDSSAIDSATLDSATIDSGSSDTGPSDAGPFDCGATESSDLPGVAMRFTTGAKCSFTLAEAAAGITIPYQVKIDRDVSGVVLGYDSRDISRRTDPGSSGLHVFEYLTGGTQRYCICDSGLPSPPSTTARELKIGTYPLEFKWDGKNWYGPSDTSNPKGAPFPAGVYLLEVRAKGTAPGGGAPFEVKATINVRLVP